MQLTSPIQELPFKKVSLYQQLRCLTAPFWTNRASRTAWGLTLLLIILVILYTISSVWLTHWQKSLFDHLQQGELSHLWQSFLSFIGILALLFLSHGYAHYFTGLIGLHWQRFLTKKYLTLWTTQPEQLCDDHVDNPDQRLSQDIQLFPEQTMQLAHSLFASLLLLGSFSWVLWQLSSPLPVSSGTHYQLFIPGYLCWLALIWAIISSYITLKIARPLVTLDYDQQRYMANYRKALLLQHEKTTNHSKRTLYRLFTPIIRNYQAQLIIKKRYTFFNTFFSSATFAMGILAALPSFITHHLQTGGLLQAGLAFSQVSMALSFIVLRYMDIAQWQAVVKRLHEFVDTLKIPYKDL